MRNHRRREFIALLGTSAAAWPLAARAQLDGRMRRISVLMSYPENDPETRARLAAFRLGFEKLGWSEGRNVRFDQRFVAASDLDRLPTVAKELVALRPDVILVFSGPHAVALQRETRTIPVVFVAISDPIGIGLIQSLARPGGNFTGFQNFEATIAGKWIGMLKEIAPHLDRVAFLGNPKDTPFDYYLRTAEPVARALAIDLVPFRVADFADTERVVGSFAGAANVGLVFLPDILFAANRDLVVALAARSRLPAVYPSRIMVVGGGLMCYSTDVVDMFRQAAAYVDRILRGEKPADLPVQAPVKYETVLNMKTAKEGGVG
jgi:ABC-type uncharacterized transport system substrate-binding protein